tara:strand:+ start:482 stop:718 length:237 start_codon:yes stop_codon:yes gene_type:complete
MKKETQEQAMKNALDNFNDTINGISIDTRSRLSGIRASLLAERKESEKRLDAILKELDELCTLHSVEGEEKNDRSKRK